MSRCTPIGQSTAHKRVLYLIDRIACTDVEILITGETGVGQERKRYAHQCSPACSQNFIAINCGGMPSELFENELFGHVDGAFTGGTGDASRARHPVHRRSRFVAHALSGEAAALRTGKGIPAARRNPFAQRRRALHVSDQCQFTTGGARRALSRGFAVPVARGAGRGAAAARTPRRSNGNIAHAAAASGKPRRVFFELMRKHGVKACECCALDAAGSRDASAVADLL